MLQRLFEEKVPGIKLVGKDDKGRKLSQKGDIITDGIHIGIISNPNELTISANEEKIVETNFGFSENAKNKTFKIFRYNENSLNSFSSISDSSNSTLSNSAPSNSTPIKTESESSAQYFITSLFLLFLFIFI